MVSLATARLGLVGFALFKQSLSADPYVVTPSGQWLGNDGSWSTFEVGVGSPTQTFQLLVSINTQEFSIPHTEGCDKLQTPDCGTARGVVPFDNRRSNGFQPNASSTWENIGLYEYGPRIQGYNITALYGYDSISLNGGEPIEYVATDQLIAGVALPGIWLGSIGVNSRELAFAESEVAQSLLATMKKNGTIPSLSFGYQAGAVYKNTRTTASLTLGGYDRSRMAPDNITVPIAAEGTLPFVVGLQSVLAENSLLGTVSLSDSTGGILTSLDSQVSELWLPREMCDKFEAAFGLQFDETSDRYLVNDTTRSQLLNLSPTVSIKIATSKTGGEVTTVEFPFAAFDLEATYPIFDGPTYYFPLRRAANETQYMLGRVFLQETYLIADWERETFTIAPAVFTSPMPETDIVTILPKDLSDITQSISGGGKGKLPVGAIAGIAVGGVAVVGVLVFLGWFCGCRKRRSGKSEPVPTEDPDGLSKAEKSSAVEPTTYELGGGRSKQSPYDQTTYELGNTGTAKNANAIGESKQATAYEMQASYGNEGRNEYYEMATPDSGPEMQHRPVRAELP